MTTPLTVYKASAGSGKTFTLAVEYIKLLIQDPQGYREILAVTFTNKATEEMKQRILSQLYGIWKQLDDSKTYSKAVCESLGLNEETVSKRAGIALHLLLHHYSYFRVETIDAFFQSVLRNLARELDLTANLRIELNDTQVEEQAVDRMIEGLDNSSQVLQWIMKYINDNISDDKGWNVIGQIKKFGQTIFRDFYKQESKAIEQKMEEDGFFDSFTQRLQAEKTDSIECIREIAETFFDTIDAEGLSVSDLLYGNNGVAGMFIKMRKGIFDSSIVGKRVSDCLEDPAKWVKKTHPNCTSIKMTAEQQLLPILRYAIDERPKLWWRYKSASVALKHLDQLRLLGTIERKVRELNQDSNRFLLSDTQSMLHSLIKDTDSPFIFEKIGAKLEHVMIDEFQDTSTIQWQNFKVLLLECMSHQGSTNLIVGDVKQSIYRWRSGDWRLLNDIEKHFPYPQKQIKQVTLAVNYRSKGNIVTFNNEFFTSAQKVEADALDNKDYATQLNNAYSDVRQQLPQWQTHDGRVEVTLLPNDDYEQQTLDEIKAIVDRLIASGIKQSGIAILVRTNRYIPLIASFLMDSRPDVNVVSNEAFRLDASVAVNTIICALKLLNRRDDIIVKATLVKVFQKEILKNALSDNDLLLDSDSYDSLLPKEFITDMDGLSRLSLYELAERLYSIFELDRLEGQSAYLCAFYDQLGSFTEDNFSDLDTFLDEWEKRFCSKTINSDDMEGIRILSIHKSKGLEFDNVIVPFCDWELEKSNVLWCKANEEPYNELPLIPIDFSKKNMMETAFEKNYMDEHFQNVVDNLNLLYVAFTRASHNLFVIGKKDKASSRSQIVQSIIGDVAKTIGHSAHITNDGSVDGEPLTFEFGNLYVPKSKEKRQTDNVFLKKAETISLEIEPLENKTEFYQSNQSRDFIENLAGDTATDNEGYIKIGNLLHHIFSTIRTKNDIDEALRQLEANGVLYDERLTPQQISSMLRKRLADPRVADWFSGRWKVYNECTILTRDAKTGAVKERRPDRVMNNGNEMIVVDFKFGRERPEYVDQVKEYMALLTAMGNKKVSGYLWFVYNNKIVEV